MTRRLAAALVAALVAWSAAGCAAHVDLDAHTADQLQQAVGDVVTAAEQGRYEAARAALAHARSLLDEAADEGHLSVRRYRLIDDALTRTDAELTASLRAADGTVADQAAADQAAADQAAADQAAEAARHASVTSGDGGPSKGGGHGSGKSGGKGSGKPGSHG